MQKTWSQCLYILKLIADKLNLLTNTLKIIKVCHAGDGPCSLCLRKLDTVARPPIEINGECVCKVAIKHLPKPRRRYIQSFIRQLMKIMPKI